MMTKASCPQTSAERDTLTVHRRYVDGGCMIRSDPLRFNICLLSDIRTSEEEDVGDDIIHRRQECGEYYRRGHERDKQPRRRQQRSVCGLNRSQNLQRPSWIRINTVGLFH